MIITLTLAFTLPGQVHQKPSGKSSQDSIVEVKWPVGRAYDYDVICVGRLQAVHLLHELRDDATMYKPAASIA